MTITARQVCRYLAMLLYLGLGAQGAWSAYGQLDDAETLGQQAQTAFQFGFAAFGIAAGALLAAGRRVPAAIEWGWTITLALAGAFGAVAWGETSIPIGVVGGISTALIALAIVWLGRRGRAPERVVDAEARESS